MFVSWENVREIKQKEKLERKKEKWRKKKGFEGNKSFLLIFIK